MAPVSLNPEASLGGVQPLFEGDPLILTSNFQNLGGEILIKGGKSLLLWLKILNASVSTDVQFKLIFLQTSGGDQFYPPFYIINPRDEEIRVDENIFIINRNETQNPTLEIGLNNFVPLIQIQARDTNDGGGQITAAAVSFSINESPSK